MDNIIYINLMEVVLLGFSLVCLFVLALKNTESVTKSIALAVLLIPALYLSIEGATQFLTIDALNYNVKEAIYLQEHSMRQWYMYSNRTTDLITGTLLNLFQKYTYIGKAQMSLDELKMLAKAIQWFVGFLVIILIYILINNHYISQNQKTTYFFIYFYSVLLLPTNILALKIFNADILSLVFGVLAVVLLLIAIKTEDSRYAIFSIITGMLAAQEKLIASPILLFSFAIFIYLKLNQDNNISYKKSLYYSFYAIFIAFLTSLITFVFVAMVVRGGEIPSISFSNVIHPMVTFVNMLIRAVYGNIFATPPSVNSSFALLIIGCILSVLSFVLIKNKLWIRKLTFVSFFKKHGMLIAMVATLLVFLIGGIGTYLIEAFYHPLYPIKEGNYFPNYSFNRVILHFGVDSFFKHIISYFGFAYAMFVVAIPSVYLVLLIFGFKFLVKQDDKDFLNWKIVLLISLLMPFVYAVTNIPLSSRYFNIFLFLVILVFGLELSRFLSSYSQFKKSGLIFLFVTLLMAELLPFRPVIGAFRPIWDYSSIEMNNIPITGKFSTSWRGWGEELFIVGKQIEHKIRTDQITKTNDIRLYWVYPGEWLERPSHLKLGNPYRNRRFTKSDYYIFNRAAFVGQRNGSFFRENVKPFFTLSYRGFTQAWIYRGDQPNLQKLWNVQN